MGVLLAHGQEQAERQNGPREKTVHVGPFRG
jgi:hypothetical protein